ncbi:MAG: PfaD family polyunsaturated fatty acid/polyketide biosynthesis protein [Planctomycetes bacterium]|nr:PfaD family polyunsaturated fatty acid/polyketide biosynthesis protein [Planctomycetota bacterium]
MTAPTTTLAVPATAAPVGVWRGDDAPALDPAAIEAKLRRVDQPVTLITLDDRLAAVEGGAVWLGDEPTDGPAGRPALAHCPALSPERLGDAGFRIDHGLRFAYVAGAMANGIASVDLVDAIARAGMLGFFGAAGLDPVRIEHAIDEFAQRGTPPRFGFNLIHSPNEPDLEKRVVDLYLRRGIRSIEASAYLALTPHVVRYRVSGLRRDPDGTIVAPNRIMAKVSRVEVAERFLSPPPDRLLGPLVESGAITREEADLARHIAMADDLTAEADSGGHTDNRPALALLPTLMGLRDRLAEQHGTSKRIRVGAAGGIATPLSAAAAFAMGADYLVAGTVHQACRESGTSDLVRRMLAEAGQADVAMAPAADMFEMGVKVQVLKRGTLFAMRAGKLYELYRQYDRFESVPAGDRAKVEEFFQASFEEVWLRCVDFFSTRDPKQLERAERDPKHRMALAFRWYLGLSSHWANRGDAERKADFQIWCGPAMGAFNEWTRDSFLADPAARDIATVATNLMFGASLAARHHHLRDQGVAFPPSVTRIPPVPLASLAAILEGRR